MTEEEAKARAAEVEARQKQETEERLSKSLLSVKDVLSADVPLPKLLPTGWANIIAPGLTLVTGEAGSGKTTFMLCLATRMALRSEFPVLHIDLEMGEAYLKMTYQDILSVEERNILGGRNFTIIGKEAFYGSPSLIRSKEQVLAAIDKAGVKGGLVLLDGTSEYASWAGVDHNSSAEARQMLSEFSVHAKQHGYSVCVFEHLSKSAIREGEQLSMGSIEKTNAADGSIFVESITPFSHEAEGGIRVGTGAKRVRGGHGNHKPRYFKAGGQGEGRQLLYKPITFAEMPLGHDATAILEWMTANAFGDKAMKRAATIGTACDLTAYEYNKAFNVLEARSQVVRTTKNNTAHYYIPDNSDI